MALYELRTYTYQVGRRGEALKIYQEEAWPALEGRFDDKLVGYFVTDVGTLNQLVHLWKFEDDADRRDHWARLLTDEAFLAVAAKMRPLNLKQENMLLSEAPWGPHP